MGSQISKYFEGTPLTGTLADSMFKNSGPSSCAFTTKWTDLTKGSLEYLWSLWEILKSSNLIFLKLDWITVAQKFAELSGMLIFIGILRLPNVMSPKLPLCKIIF